MSVFHVFKLYRWYQIPQSITYTRLLVFSNPKTRILAYFTHCYLIVTFSFCRFRANSSGRSLGEFARYPVTGKTFCQFLVISSRSGGMQGFTFLFVKVISSKLFLPEVLSSYFMVYFVLHSFNSRLFRFYFQFFEKKTVVFIF